MPSVKDSLSFGQYLQTLRLEKKISLEKVSEETRIGLGMLKLIEKEEHDKLPAEVFVKGFLRAYARAIGADGGEAVRRYESRLNVVLELSGSQTKSGPPNAALWWKLMLVVVLYFGLILLTLYGIAFVEAYSDRQTVLESQAIGEQPAATNAQVPNNLEAEGDSEDSDSDKYLLRITAREETWMKIIADNGAPSEYQLSPGEQLELEASSNFNLLVGNAAGVKITLNDKQIPVLGKDGEIINLNLP
jgi:cytoskeletal protein RodZ